MSYCSHCGAQQMKSGEVCEVCGKRLGVIGPVPDTRAPERKKSDTAISATLEGINYCSHCGAVIPDGDYCSHCGKPIKPKAK